MRSRQPSDVPPPPEGMIRAVVAEVRKNGNEWYAVSYPELAVTDPPISRRTSITFARDDWKHDDPPLPRQVVDLENVTLFTGGWRARAAHPIVAHSN